MLSNKTVIVAALLTLAAHTTPLVAQTAAADTAAADTAALAGIAGRVFDLSIGRPLANAAVQLVSATSLAVVRRDTSDGLGRFDMADVPAGSYLVGFTHPRLDSLLLDSPVVSALTLVAGQRSQVTLAVPSLEAIYSAWCGEVERPVARASTSSTPPAPGIFLGRVRASAGLPLPDSTHVEVSWMDVLVGRGGATSEPQSSVMPVSAEGSFAVCGLPPEAVLNVRAFAGSATSGTIEIEVPSNRLLLRSLQLPVGPASTGALRGTVVSGENAPISGARVRVAGSAAISLTDAAGRFVIADAPLGTQTLEAVAIGYSPRGIALDIAGGGSDTARLVLQSTRNQLESVTITADSWRAGFENRRSRRYGQFLDAEAIRRKQPQYIADVLQAVPSITTTATGAFGREIFVRGCKPTVFIDGKRAFVQTFDLDAVVAVDSLMAVEVYDVPDMIPFDFHAEPGCGAIVLWTRKGRP